MASPRAQGAAVRATARRPLVRAFEALDEHPAVDAARARALAAQGDDELAAAVESDVGLTIALLRAAGAAEVRQAVERLGPEECRRLVEAVPTFDFLRSAPRAAQRVQQFAIHAASVQRVARRLAHSGGQEGPDELMAAALLHDVGKLVLEVAYPEYPERIHGETGTPEERVAREQRALGTDHATVGGELARWWGLPAAVCDAIAGHHAAAAGGAAGIVRLADLLANFEQGRPIDPATALGASLAVGIGREALGGLMYELVQPLQLAGGSDELCPLTARELEILAALSRGRLYKQIAAELGLSASTVRNHLHRAYRKLGAADRTQAVLMARERGWL